MTLRLMTVESRTVSSSDDELIGVVVVVDGRVGVLFAWRVTCSLAMKDHSRVRVALEAARARVQEVEALPPRKRTYQQVFPR